MKAFLAALSSLFTANNKSWLTQILTGAGLGLISIGALTVFLDYYKNNAINSFGQLGTVTGLLGLSGVDKAISIVIGAYLAAMYIKTFAAGLKVVKK